MTPRLHTNPTQAVVFDDPRYGVVFESVSPITSGLKNLGFAVAEVIAGRESPASFHRRTEEVYYILSGRGVMTLDEASIEVFPGDTISIPIGCVHRIRNPGPERLRFAVATSPPYDPADDTEV